MERFRLRGHEATPLRFTFDGRALTGRAGDTLAAALLANGIHFVARSFKYHRPRGIVAAGAEEPSAFVAVGDGARLDTNSQATRVVLHDGLTARSINRWPSLRWDAAAIFGRLGRFIPAGFYYKTFFWPNWLTYESAIRRAAGLGVAPVSADPDRYDRSYRHCDVLVVGGGPAGLAAASAAARTGVDVLLIEQDDTLGGALLWEDQMIDGLPGARWAAERASELAALANVTVMTRTSVSGYYDHNYLTALEQHDPGSPFLQTLCHIRAARVVLATGATERPLVFPANDRPGIMLASAVRHYLARFGVAAGRSMVVATNNDDAYRTARALVAAGIEVAAIVDSRAATSATVTGMPVHRASVIAGTHGHRRVRSVVVRSLDGATTRVACDVVAMSGGWNPAVQLFSQSGGKLRFDDRLGTFVPDRAAQETQVVGAAAGKLTLGDCLATGWAAFATTPVPWRADQFESDAVEPMWRVPDAVAEPGKQWIDFHNDVTDVDVTLAARENFHSVEHLKRYTTLGMAPDQGKTSNVNGLALLGEATGRTPGQVGTTTFRPPFTPIAFGAIAGRDRDALFSPARRLPTHALQVQAGACLDDYGAWLRPSHYPRGGEDMRAAVTREVRAARQGVAMLDYSPLGKIAVAGPDATDFLNRLTTTNLATLKSGHARYNLTLSETGAIVDDGVISRLADGSLLMGTTSGAARRGHALLEEWHQCECPGLDVSIVNITDHWAVLMLTGPRGRTLLARVGTDIDLSAMAFPHMTVREGRLDGIPLRINRVSFTGEVTFEVSVPSGYGAALWQRLAELGDDLGLTPIGLEALDVLRLEKGFFHVGGDTDGITTPDDVGFGGMVRNKPSDFRGKRSLRMPGLNGPRRLQLIGLKTLDGETPLAVGAQLSAATVNATSSGEGLVTSSVWSPTFERPIALGLLADGRARLGERVHVWHDRRHRIAEVVLPQLYDPKGARLLD